MKCEFADKCGFYIMNKDGPYRKETEKFCNVGGDFCARKTIRRQSGIESVPHDLLPNGKRMGG